LLKEQIIVKMLHYMEELITFSLDFVNIHHIGKILIKVELFMYRWCVMLKQYS